MRLLLVVMCVFVLINLIECRPNSDLQEDNSTFKQKARLVESVKTSRPVKSEPKRFKDYNEANLPNLQFAIDSVANMAELLAEGYGYPCESHEVTTEDGYILTLHRIPRGRKVKNEKGYRPVALLLHGFLASSDSWLFRGPGKDLPYVFAEAGYDTWIMNSRGNVFSRKHVTLNPDIDSNFWNFSIHEYGLYDLPASIDYALNATNQSSLFFLGHSIGATAFFIMCSLKPDYNSKIKLANALAPAVIISHSVSPFTQFLLSLVPPLMTTLKNNGMLEVFPQRQIFATLGKRFCNDGAITQPMCLLLMFASVGSDYEQFNHTMFPTALTYYPAGTSVDVLNHLHKIFSGNFQPLNNMDEKNITYDLQKVTAPVALHYGDGDALVYRADNEILASKLPNPVGIFRVPHRNFNHIDFMWSTDSKILLYDHLITLMDKYR